MKNNSERKITVNVSRDGQFFLAKIGISENGEGFTNFQEIRDENYSRLIRRFSDIIQSVNFLTRCES